MSEGELQSGRIGHLLTPGALSGKRLLVVGIGSVGFPVVQNLAMCGVSDWVLVDCDELGDENLVKHPGMRRDLGRMKTEIAAEWVLDRNPRAVVERLDVDITTEDGHKSLEGAIGGSSLVVCCTDDKNTRLIVNRACVESLTPCVTGLVYRTGFGGDSFLYDPGRSGCYDCFLERSTSVSVGRLLEDSRALSEVEDDIAEARYGRRADEKYGLSGLSIDIQFVSLLVCRMALPALLGESIDEGMREMFSRGGPELTRREAHLLRLPYDYRGGTQPVGVERRSVWLNTDTGEMMGMQPSCANCHYPSDPAHYYCPNCGFLIEYPGEEGARRPEDYEASEAEGAELLLEWVPIPTPEGHMVNHVSFVSRRHLVDEIPPDGSPRTGNAVVVAQPFTISANPIPPSTDCQWCSEGEEAME